MSCMTESRRALWLLVVLALMVHFAIGAATGAAAHAGEGHAPLWLLLLPWALVVGGVWRPLLQPAPGLARWRLFSCWRPPIAKR